MSTWQENVSDLHGILIISKRTFSLMCCTFITINCHTILNLYEAKGALASKWFTSSWFPFYKMLMYICLFLQLKIQVISNWYFVRLWDTSLATSVIYFQIVFEFRNMIYNYFKKQVQWCPGAKNLHSMSFRISFIKLVHALLVSTFCMQQCSLK
jgi:hypothetical protein